MPRAYLTPSGDYVKVCRRPDCEKAGMPQPADILHFARRTSQPDGFDVSCKLCQRRYYRENRDKLLVVRRDYERRLYAAQKRNLNIQDARRYTMTRKAKGPKKTCTKCKVAWPAVSANFRADKKNTDGLYSWCRRCHTETDRSRMRTLRGTLMERYKGMRRRVEGRDKTHVAGSRGKALVSRDEFIAWGLAHPEYLRLHAAWVASGYARHMGPSIDRIDPDKGYTFDNMQWLTTQQNTAKCGQDKILRLMRSAKKKIAPDAKLTYNGLDV